MIHDRRIRPGGGYAALAESLEMDRSRLTAILRGRATPAERSYKGEVPEIDRVAKEFRLTKANVRRISLQHAGQVPGGFMRLTEQTKRTFGRVR